jgi:hypothetical protein
MRKEKAVNIFAQKGKNVPKRVFVKWQWDQREPWLEADEEVVPLAKVGEAVYVGEYQLVKVHKVDLKAVTKEV